MPPKISIVIPAYNAEDQIFNTITSVLSQTYTDYEIIVVNDGSTDNTLNLLEQFGDKINIINQPNGGVSKARNVGIKASKGKYIAFLDSDDLWHPSKLLIQVDMMESNNDWLASYTSTSFNSSNEFKNDIKVSIPPFMEKNIKDIFNDPYLVTSSFVIVNTFCQSINSFNEDLPTAEDIDLYLRTSVLGKIGYINEVLTWKADVEGSLGSSLSSYEDNLFVIDKFLKDNPELYSLLCNDIKQIRAKIYQGWGKDLLWVNSPIQALPILLKAQRHKFSLMNCLLILKAIVKSILLPLKRIE